MSKKSSSGSALSALAMRWLSTAWLLFWFSLKPGRLPPDAADSSNRRPCDTFADSDAATGDRKRKMLQLCKGLFLRILILYISKVTFSHGPGRWLWATVQWQPAALILYWAALVIHAVALKTTEQVKETLISQHVRAQTLKKYKHKWTTYQFNHNSFIENKSAKQFECCIPSAVPGRWSDCCPKCCWCLGGLYSSLQTCTSSLAGD